MPTHLSLLTAVLDGHRPALVDVIAAIPVGDESPFASVPGTHNGRFVVVSTEPSPSARRRAGGLPGPMLMTSGVIGGTPTEWVGELLSVLGPTADAVWSHCAGWTEADDKLTFLLSHRVHPALEFATWTAPVERVRRALQLHTRASSLAVRSHTMSPADLVKAYTAEVRS